MGKVLPQFHRDEASRDDGNGLALLISPLLALMRNQIPAAQHIVVHAATINSDTRWQRRADRQH